jgi:hypothetical protein
MNNNTVIKIEVHEFDDYEQNCVIRGPLYENQHHVESPIQELLGDNSPSADVGPVIGSR